MFNSSFICITIFLLKQSILTAIYQLIKKGARIKGYTAWSFMDSFEWASGYNK